MKISQSCYDCLERLIYQAVQLATPDTLLRQKAIEDGVKILNIEFSYNQISIVIATKIHKLVKEVTGNPNPYQTMKDKEMEIARELYPELLATSKKRSNLYEDDFRDCLKLAAAANIIDFFREPSVIKEDIRKPVSFAIDDSEYLEARLKSASEVLYLADNAGEIYFDLPLVKWMKQFTKVTYVVKPLPVQDDATLEDIRKAGLESEFGRIITTGTASPGIILALASDEFKREFESADLIFAKGMGHYESLSELPRQGKFFYCLMAKCQPVADSLGVPLNSYVAMLW